MKNPMKQTWAMLAAALVMAAGMGCASHFQKGYTALENKEYDTAIVEFTEEIRLNPEESAEAYNNRGYAYRMRGNLDLAIADFEKALRLNPNFSEAKQNLDNAKKRLENQMLAQQQANLKPTPQPVQTASSNPSKPAPAARTATRPKPAAIDELDIAIRDASDYLNEKVPKGNKIVVLNVQSASADLSDYIIDELIANAVNDGFFTVVDRQQLDVIQKEQKFQMSGAVDDKDAQAIGKFFGAQTVVSGAVNRLGATGYRVRIRALEVQTAQVQGQYNQNIASSKIMNSLMAIGSSTSGSPTTSSSVTGATPAVSGSTTPAVTTTPAAQTRTATPAEPPIQGIAVPGNSLEEKLTWLTRSADSHNTYIIEVNADETIAPHTFEFSGGINITVVLRGDKENRTIRLRSNGTMFEVGTNVIFILDNNITLQGHSGNKGRMVRVNGGAFRMRTGSAITGNTDGGVNVYNGTFEMSGGTISTNTAFDGGGVFNDNYGTFIMTGGIISGNTANRMGGGVCVWRSTFTMRGGTIAGNTAHESGGGLSTYGGTFVKSGGTITGYSSDQTNGNVVRDADNYILGRKGHAVWGWNGNKRKETTAGPNVNLSIVNSKDPTGAWDQ